MNEEKVWRWNADLAWELFSSAVYNYRLSLKTSMEHKKHAFQKNTIFSAVTAVEAFANNLLAKEKNWSERQINNCKDILGEFGIDYNNSAFKKSKYLRNHFIVETNEISTLEAIESVQEVIAEISFSMGKIFPYWITGLNFRNPAHGNDIFLLNDHDFWYRLRFMKITDVSSKVSASNGLISVPTEISEYMALHKDIWQLLKANHFDIPALNTANDPRFPFMPILCSDWWN
jgi:hypothetical protein